MYSDHQVCVSGSTTGGAAALELLTLQLLNSSVANSNLYYTSLCTCWLGYIICIVGLLRGWHQIKLHTCVHLIDLKTISKQNDNINSE